MDAILKQRQGGSTALHTHDIQKAGHTLCDSTGDIGLDPIIDFLFQPVFVGNTTVYREKRVIDRNHRKIPDELSAEQCFIDLFPIKPFRKDDVAVFAHAASPSSERSVRRFRRFSSSVILPSLRSSLVVVTRSSRSLTVRMSARYSI